MLTYRLTSRRPTERYANFAFDRMTKVDYAEKCTSLLNDALGHWLITLDLDGTIGRIYEQLLEQKAIKTCGVSEAGGLDEESGHTALSVEQMGGTMLVHALVVCIVIAGSVLHRVRIARSEPAAKAQRASHKHVDTRPSTKSDLKCLHEELRKEIVADLLKSFPLLPLLSGDDANATPEIAVSVVDVAHTRNAACGSACPSHEHGGYDGDTGKRVAESSEPQTGPEAHKQAGVLFCTT